MTYRPCTCGHAEGDHRSNGSTFMHPLVFGVCLECDCREYISAASGDPVARETTPPSPPSEQGQVSE